MIPPPPPTTKKAIPQSSTLKECNTNLETWKGLFFFLFFFRLSFCQSVRLCCFLYRLAVAVVSGWGGGGRGAALAWRNSEAIFLTAAWEKAKASSAVFSLQFGTARMYVRGKTSRYAFYWKETQRSILPGRSGTCWWGGINELPQKKKKKKEGATLMFQQLRLSHAGSLVQSWERTCLFEALGKKKMCLRWAVSFYSAFGHNSPYVSLIYRSFCCFCWVSRESKHPSEQIQT